MKKILLIMLVLCSLATAQKPKVAVGAIGKEPSGSGALKSLSIQLTDALVKNGRYAATERSAAILQQLNEEHAYQRSGNVDDEQITELGKQLGVEYMCIVESSEIMSTFMLTAKLVNVKTAEIAGMGKAESNLANTSQIKAVGEEIASQLLKTEVSNGSENANYNNFKTGQRWATFFGNLVPGLGSAAIMNDWIGATVQWGLLVAGMGFANLYSVETGHSEYIGNGKYEYTVDGTKPDYAYVIYGVAASYLFSAFRSVVYNKPAPSTALGKYGDFNMAVLPSRKGSGMAYGVMYRLGF